MPLMRNSCLALVPNLQIGNLEGEAPASRDRIPKLMELGNESKIMPTDEPDISDEEIIQEIKAV